MEAKHKILNHLQVSNFDQQFSGLLKYLEARQTKFEGGCISSFLPSWKNLTNDPEILQMVMGLRIEFNETPLQIDRIPTNVLLKNQLAVDNEIESLIRKQVIILDSKEPSDFISPIFLRPKKDGTFRMVLNLKTLNTFVTYRHFKMDTVWTAINMMKPNCFMASIDLKDAYYSVAICADHQKFLKFYWKGEYYKFTVFPNGLALCPRKFTKLLKPVYAFLRSLGHLSVAYIDDSYLQGDTYEECLQNLIDTIKLFDSLGFIVHPSKSVFKPEQRVTFLGFVLDSVKMRVYLTAERATSISHACSSLLHNAHPSIRDLARVIGLITASFPGVMFGPLHYRALDVNKTTALKKAKGDFEKPVILSEYAIQDLHWWTQNVSDSYNEISHGNPQIVITSDASKIGWGCTCGDHKTGGNWTPQEALSHINVLEISAAYFALKAFSDTISNKHVRLMVDNTTAVACLNQMGTSHSHECNAFTQKIWQFCISHNVWITTVHIPGKDNLGADAESRKNRRETEWALNTDVFNKAIGMANVYPNIDLFSSRINHKVKPYVSFRPDPGASAVNAFSLSWHAYQFYAFPPFCIILKTLQKIAQDRATGLIVVPFWPTQPWWPYLTNMLIDHIICLPRMKQTLWLPAEPLKIHPLHKQLNLMLCHLSGDCCKVEDFQKTLQTSFNNHGDWVPKNNTNHTYLGGKNIVVKRKLIHLLAL